MGKFNFYLTAFIVIVLLGPFYLIGYTIGQPIAAIFYGHKIGRENYLRCMRDLRNKAKNDKME